ncbi:conserved hypothetical protein [Candidatus Terasakiella magnetica]|uniref:WbqC-like protein n=1 Tax=Candidatus Terasakiella magnetica TaxID=1867952 RepID=A0A1C3RGG5_9PROT|nr:WbqC family protein [Candidatus Terasakiella magnetica]SCA56292.1 conserved hypothetical protein [Candidatus Terasakiella magnetica]
MKITIHQPEHMPWSGYFHKMAQADQYVLLDNVQFKKNNWQNRNRIIDRAGNVLWLSVPVNMKGHISSTIRETTIQNSQKWQKKYIGRIRGAYAKHPYFKEYWPELENILTTEYDFIWQLNVRLIEFFKNILLIETPLVFASDLETHGNSTDLLLSICQALNADTYISGPDGASYMELEKFAQVKVDIVFHSFKPPVYEARNFEPGLSTLDLIMNCGPDSREIIGL